MQSVAIKVIRLSVIMLNVVAPLLAALIIFLPLLDFVAHNMAAPMSAKKLACFANIMFFLLRECTSFLIVSHVAIWGYVY
jgi:hypothetical protein